MPQQIHKFSDPCLIIRATSGELIATTVNEQQTLPQLGKEICGTGHFVRNDDTPSNTVRSERMRQLRL